MKRKVSGAARTPQSSDRLFTRKKSMRGGRNKSRTSSALSFQYATLEPRKLLAADLSVSFVSEPVGNPFEYGSVDVEALIARTEHRPYVAGELVVAMEFSTEGIRPKLAPDQLNWSMIAGVDNTRGVKTLLTTEYASNSEIALVQIELGDDSQLFETMRQLDRLDNVLWASPNFYQTENPLEFIPNDPGYVDQYHHPLMQNDLAWDTTLGDSDIVVAVTDDGVDIDHPDLVNNIFVNTGEIAGDGIDNDGNGYIDDVNGWDFPSNNNNPRPQGSSDNHGTHVSGIAAGDTNNGVGIAGTAGGSTIMPLQFYNYNNSQWTASLINETFTYAVDNGAQIVNTSYNIDSWVGDPVFTAGLQYIFDNGAIHFNSSGNNGALNPPRQAFENTILVANSTSTDAVSGSSNIGRGIDIVAPGTAILSTVQGGYAEFSGTSMATPNAAGVAALIWSANPGWSRDQVVAQLFATADNIDSQNSSIVGLMGYGRVNSYQGVTGEIGAPEIEIVSIIPPNGSTTNDLSISGAQLSFTQYLDPASVVGGNFELREAGPDEVLDTADDVLFPVTLATDYMYGTNDVDLSFGGALGYGQYRLTLASGGLENPFGTPLDGNGDGTGGDAYVHEFTIIPPPPVPVEAFGSFIYTRQYNGVLSSGASVGYFAIELEAGQTMSLVSASAGLSATLNVFDPTGANIGSATGSANETYLSDLALESGGEYVITLESDTNATGAYTLDLFLNTGLEVEEFGGGDNDSLLNAESLEPTSIPLGSGEADRMAVLGQLPAGDGTVVISDDFESNHLGSAWTTYSSDSLNGRIQVTGDYGEAAGDWALTMDQTNDGVYNLNEAVWTVDLAGLLSPAFAFYYTNFNDEIDVLPQIYSGRQNGDGISISENGTDWYRVWTPDDTGSGTWVREEIDLASAAAAAGMTLTSTFQIKFQQYDNFSIDVDGLGFDELEIIVPDSSDDWYQFSLEDGQAASVAATRYLDAGLVGLELYDDAGTLLATGTGAENASKIIDDFVDTTSDGVADDYYLRVIGNQGEYSLVVTRGAQFDRETNNEIVDAQSLDGRNGVLGFVSSFESVAAEPDDFAPGTVISNLIPGVSLTNPITGTDVYAETGSFAAPTGANVFAPDVGAPEGWREGDDELRATFDQLQAFVSIDVGSDDSSDVGFLAAYDESGTLLAQVVSNAISSGGSQTLTISRPTADIAYIIAAGVGGDITPLDNLQFSESGRPDIYEVSVGAGETISYNAFLPGSGPYLFENGLVGENGSNLRLEILDSNEVVLATGIESIEYEAALAGTYFIRVSAENGLGEYYLEQDPGVPLIAGIDFGDANSDVWEPYVQFATDAYQASTGYGWVDNPVGLNVFDSIRGNALAKDKAVLRNVGTFAIDVPNGFYDVDIHLGTVRRATNYRVVVEGAVDEFVTPRGPNVTRTYTRFVTDGQLTVEFDGSVALDRRIRVAGIGITPAGSSLRMNSLAPEPNNTFDSFDGSMFVRGDESDPAEDAIRRASFNNKLDRIYLSEVNANLTSLEDSASLTLDAPRRADEQAKSIPVAGELETGKLRELETVEIDAELAHVTLAMEALEIEFPWL